MTALRAEIRWLQIVLLLFWGVWSTLVALTNTTAACKAMGLLPAGWKFASGNWIYMREVISVYHTPVALGALLFAGVIVWEWLLAAAFFRAARLVIAARAQAVLTESAQRAIVQAHLLGTALWGSFLLADEFFVRYDAAATHWTILIATLVSLVVMLVTARPSSSESSHQ